MIYELRTTRVRPGGVPEFEGGLEEALPGRQQHAKLAGCWHTEIGPLLQIIELWSFEDQQSHAQSAGQGASGLYVTGDLVQSTEVELLEPTPFMKPLDGTPQQLGPVYELRIYQTRTGQLPQFVERWAPLVPGRTQVSPLVGAWHSSSGRFFHMWPYKDLAERSRIRSETRQKGIWPPDTTSLLLTQENKILLPASFSPLQ